MNCFVCCKSATSNCSKCSQVYYCSRGCQLLNWPQHKKECAELSTSAPLFTLIKRAIKDTFDLAILCGDIEIAITEDFADFSANMYFPHFAHIKVLSIKERGSYNSCVIKFNDLTIKNYTFVGDTLPLQNKQKKEIKQKKNIVRDFDVDGVNSVYFEIGAV